MKYTYLKFWPEQIGCVPFVSTMSEATKVTNRIKLDFSKCYKIDSCGLTVSLVKLHDFVNRRKSDFTMHIMTNIVGGSVPIENISQLGFFQSLEKYFDGNNLQRYYETNLFQASVLPMTFIDGGVCKKSYPIYHLKFPGKLYERRSVLSQFNEYLRSILMPLSQKYKLRFNQLISILYEMARNSADHTDNDAFLGMDICQTPKKIELAFLFADLGIGINERILQVFKGPVSKRKKHWGLGESYRVAFQKGTSTGLNSEMNSGLGLCTIYDFAKAMNINLSIFDAASRGVLTNLTQLTVDEFSTISHKQMREVFVPCGRAVPFAYYATLSAESL